MVRNREILLELLNLLESQGQLGDGGQDGLPDRHGVPAVGQGGCQEPAQHHGALLAQLWWWSLTSGAAQTLEDDDQLSQLSLLTAPVSQQPKEGGALLTGLLTVQHLKLFQH